MTTKKGQILEIGEMIYEQLDDIINEVDPFEVTFLFDKLGCSDVSVSVHKIIEINLEDDSNVQN